MAESVVAVQGTGGGYVQGARVALGFSKGVTDSVYTDRNGEAVIEHRTTGNATVYVNGLDKGSMNAPGRKLVFIWRISRAGFDRLDSGYIIFTIKIMEVVKQNVIVSANRELLIKLPKNAAPNQTAEVIILFSPVSTNGEKLALMQGAMSDPLFVADLEEIREDFRYADFDEVNG